MFGAVATEYIVFDVETTGLSVTEGDRIIELAALRLREGVVVDRLVTLVNPGRALPPGAQAVNQITEEMIADAPGSAAVLPQMIGLSANACLVAHNASFDVKFLAYELALMGRRLHDTTPVLDTMKMARAFLPYLTSYRLEALAHSLGVPVGNTHRAEADAEITAAVFLRLLDMAGDHHLHGLAALVERFGVEKPRFPVGGDAQASFF